MARIVLPHNWTPRNYQLELFNALDSGIKRAIIVWHRRSGKDSCCFNYLVKAAHQRVANYWHLFPTARQGRKALWEAVDKVGRRVIDQACPDVLRKSTRNDEMMIILKNGSTIQITGADQVDSLVGSNPAGVVMSEYALTSPQTWLYIAPILRENGGWSIFNSTPRGKNHLFELYETNKKNPRWFCSVRNWKQTGVITQADIDQEIADGMPPEVAEQEFNCSFNAPNVGVVYGRQIAVAKQTGRITRVPYDARHPVETWWDIGHRDATAIWFAQRIGVRLHLFDYYENKGHGLPHYASIVAGKGYAYDRHVGPHDLENKVWAVDASTQTVAQNHGINFVVAPKLGVKDGIDAVRTMLSRCYIDEDRCKLGIAALNHYQFEWDDERRVFGDKPVHDWSSHCADAIRYGAVTPEGIGVMPAWAKAELGQPMMIGHNGGNRFQQSVGFGPAPDTYDPLAHWRG